MNEIDGYFLCGPTMAISVNMLLSVLFFIFAVLIDSK